MKDVHKFASKYSDVPSFTLLTHYLGPRVNERNTKFVEPKLFTANQTVRSLKNYLEATATGSIRLNRGAQNAGRNATVVHPNYPAT